MDVHVCANATDCMRLCMWHMWWDCVTVLVWGLPRFSQQPSSAVSVTEFTCVQTTALHLPFLFDYQSLFICRTPQCPVALALSLCAATFTFISLKTHQIYSKILGPCLSVLTMSAYQFMSDCVSLFVMVYVSFSRSVSVCYWVAWLAVAPAAGQKTGVTKHARTT